MGQTHEQRIAQLTDTQLVAEMQSWVETGLWHRALERFTDHCFNSAYAYLAIYTAEYMRRHSDAPPNDWPSRFDADHKFVH